MQANQRRLLRDVISTGKVQYYIPVYQRHYAWKTKNCERLFDDICQLIPKEEKTHFIGSIVYKALPAEPSFSKFVLIDGQQRLITVSLLLKALHEIVSDDTNLIRIKKDLETLLFNDSDTIPDQDCLLRMKPAQKDAKTYEAIIKNSYKALGSIEDFDKKSQLYKNYKYFYTRLSHMCFSFTDFYNALYRLEVVLIGLDYGDEPQRIFESLNSTGSRLGEVDKIRNYIFMKIQPNQQNTSLEQKWFELEDKLGNSLDGFIRDYVISKKGIVIQKNALYYEFKRFVDEFDDAPTSDGKSALDIMFDYSKDYCLLINENESKNMSRPLRDALLDTVTLGMKTTFPFLLRVLHAYSHEQISEKDTINTLRLIESYAFRRSICNIQGGALSQLMADMSVSFFDDNANAYENFFDAVAHKMATVGGNASFPKDDMFFERFSKRDCFNYPLKKYILTKLECSVQSKEPVSTDGYTVEHVMPQKLTAEWRKHLNDSGIKEEDIDEFHEENVNRIGNLTLTSYNSEMGQKLIQGKKEYSTSSRLIINKYFDPLTKWGKEEIETRSNDLATKALEIWKYPEDKLKDVALIDSYNIMRNDIDEKSFTGTKPCAVKFNGVLAYVQSWNDIYLFVMRTLYDAAGDKFISLLSGNYCDSVTPLISKQQESLRKGEILSDGYYIEINQNVTRKIHLMKSVITDLGLNNEPLIVKLSPEE